MCSSCGRSLKSRRVQQQREGLQSLTSKARHICYAGGRRYRFGMPTIFHVHGGGHILPPMLSACLSACMGSMTAMLTVPMPPLRGSFEGGGVGRAVQA